MECPVCYTETAKCQFVCGHAFCFDCVKQWYSKSTEHNCPMCRKSIAFKGISKLKNIWDRDSHLGKVRDIYIECVEDVCEHEDPEDIIEALMCIEKKYNALKATTFDFVEDEVRELLETPWIEFVEEKRKMFYEPMTHTRYLFVPNTSRELKRGEIVLRSLTVKK